MKMTIGKRVIFGFAVSVIITIILSVFAYMRVSAINKEIVTINDEIIPGLGYMGDIDSLSNRNVKLLLMHVAAKTPEQMSRVEDQIKEANEETDAAYKGYEDQITDEEDRRNFNHLSELRGQWRQAKDRVFALGKAQKDAEAMDLFNSDTVPIVEAMHQQTKLMSKYNRNEAEVASKDASSLVSSTKTAMLIGAALAVVLASTIGAFIIRGVNAALKKIAETLSSGSEQVASASSQVSSSSQSLAQGASEQAASLEETSSALEEMSSMTKKNAESAQQAAGLASEAKSAADKGNVEMDRMGRAIAEIEKSASETAKIIKVIDEIAFQTNLLALNAAVEAARAGEAGKGFAVVAEEVRNLAMRSAEAAKNTAAMIEESVKSAKNGVQIATEVGKTLAEITGSNEKVNALISEIAAASAEQAQGIGQVNTAVTQMDKVTQGNAAAAEESASASEELSSQAMELNGVVSTLLELVTGSDAGRETRIERRPVKRAAPASTTRPQHAKPAVKPSQVLPLGEPSDSNEFAAFNEA